MSREVEGIVLNLAQKNTHTTLSEALERYGLPDSDDGSKRERVERCVELIQRESLPGIADRMLASGDLCAEERNGLQEAMWRNDINSPTISRRTRHEISRAIDVEALPISWEDFVRLLENLWVIDDDPFAALNELFGQVGTSRSLRTRIEQHVGRNRGDWSTEELFKQLGAFDSSDRRFGLFLEGLSSSAVLPDESTQRNFVENVNKQLSGTGAKLEECGEDGGYPVFQITSTATRKNRTPKNLIFASPRKPDIRFINAVDNDIEVMDGADDVLIFDEQIGQEGIRWHDLQEWWTKKQGISDAAAAKRSLYARLLDGIPSESPPQRELFLAYHREFQEAIPGLPALMPEVWLHWDPKTVRQRGPEALLRFRMDFLLLLPHKQRIVLEVDGKHHYSNPRGEPDPEAYARNMIADRELKLAGYEVFRFGAVELRGERAGVTVGSFFRALFYRYGVRIPNAQ